MMLCKGTKIGDYILDEEIDSGGEATVWKAHRPGNKELAFALKIRKPIPFKDKEEYEKQREKVDNEKNAWITFRHGSVYVVSIHDVLYSLLDMDDEEYIVSAIVTEFSEIGNLFSLLASGKVEKYIPGEIEFIELLLNITSGVWAGHLRDLVHCDIKPMNILLFKEPDGSVIPKIADFGISRKLYETMAGRTPQYSAPEVDEHSAPTFAQDIFSLGLTFTQILVFMVGGDASVIEENNRLDSWSERKSHFTGYLTEATSGTSWGTTQYFRLFENMMRDDPDERISLDEVDAFLKEQKNSLIRTNGGVQIKVNEHSYQWNNEVHKTLNSTLYILLLKGGAPIPYVEAFKRNVPPEINGYAISTLAGAWDYCVRIWSDAESIARHMKAIRVFTDEILCFEVVAVDYRSKGQKLNYNERKLLIEIDECSRTKKPFESLRNKGLVVKKINNSSKLFQVIIVVDIKKIETGLAEVYGENIRRKLELEDTDISDLTVYTVKTDAINHNDTKLIICFRHKDFSKCRTSLSNIYNEFYEKDGAKAFNFSTQFEMVCSADMRSDDGQIFEKLRNALSGTMRYE